MTAAITTAGRTRDGKAADVCTMEPISLPNAEIISCTLQSVKECGELNATAIMHTSNNVMPLCLLLKNMVIGTASFFCLAIRVQRLCLVSLHTHTFSPAGVECLFPGFVAQSSMTSFHESVRLISKIGVPSVVSPGLGRKGMGGRGALLLGGEG